MAPTDQPAAYGLARPVGPQRRAGVLVVEKCLEPHDAANLETTPKEISDESGMLLDHMERPVLDPIAERNDAPIQMPFLFEAAILSRIRSPVTSRSNWAKDKRTFRVNRPMLVVVLNAWVTETNDT
jgi:hypothetical protein